MTNSDQKLIAGEKLDDLTISWHAVSAEEALDHLKTPLQTGLTSAEVLARRQRYGTNELVEGKRTTFFEMILGQLKNFVVILLIVASVISALLGDYVEAAAILAIVVLNSALGVIQESRAEQALAALKKLAAPEAHVLRDGQRTQVPAVELVPGDIVYMEAGNYIAADVRLLEAVNLRVEEASLTGESLPVQKNAAVVLEEDIPLGDRTNTAFMGTLVSYGRGRGVVIQTGMHTQLGMITTMLQSVEREETPLQRRLDQLGKLLGWGALAVCALIFIIGAIRIFAGAGGLSLAAPATQKSLVDLFMIAVSLAIAGVPEGLPAIVTISLALGMSEMVRRKALIRRLSSVETLGSTTVICSDKTGTLTQNEMTMTHLWVDGNLFTITGSGYTPTGEFELAGETIDLSRFPGARTALWVGVLNNDAKLEMTGAADGESTYRVVGDPTEGAILVAAAKGGATQDDINLAYPRSDEIPFDSDRKRMVTIHTIENPQDEDISPIYGQEKRQWNAITVKGAPDIVLNLCQWYQTINDETVPLDAAARQSILQANDGMTREALRVLGMAYRLVPDMPQEMETRQVENNLVFAGLVGMIDPPRIEVTDALQKATQAGIRTIMITGDYPNTARAIAESIGLMLPGHKVLTGKEISQLDDRSLEEEVKVSDVYARVSPEHKLRIVNALRANGEIVAMTGDGVNDAPAIKRADIGISMGITGTDVAKETADMVLIDDNYASIVSAVEQGRIIYSNIRKFVYFLLSCNIAEISIIFLATLFGWPSPLTAIQLLWLNLVTDGAPALALGTEKGDPDIMDQKPRPAKEPIINTYIRNGIAIQMIAKTAVTLGAFYIGLNLAPNQITLAQTMAFVTLSCSELLRAFTARSEFNPIFRIGPFSNKYMNIAAISSLVLILVIVYVPFLNGIFNTVSLEIAQWSFILPLIFIPAIADELTKFVFGPKADK